MLHPGKKISSDDDTIVAVITPPGEGGIAALRLAGKKSLALLLRFFQPAHAKKIKFSPFLLRYGFFQSTEGGIIDEITAVYMPEGESYTGLEQAEIFCHGGCRVVRVILDELVRAGARPAEPGEFTRLAFLNGRIDLTRAEAVADMVAASTEVSLKVSREHLLGTFARHIENLRNDLIKIIADLEASIDFPDEEIVAPERSELLGAIDDILAKLNELAITYTGGKIIKEGYQVAIGGRPNAGKSSLFNRLLRQERALVTATAGTTRDYLSEWLDLGGIAVNLIDTAGIRVGGSTVEKSGREKALKIFKDADLILWLVDLSSRGWKSRLEDDLKYLDGKLIMLIGNKIDLVKEFKKDLRAYPGIIPVSCLDGSGLKKLKSNLIKNINKKMPDLTSGVVVTSARHKQKLEQAIEHVKSARMKLVEDESPEFTAFDLNQATRAIDEITGKVYNEQILDEIFARFCIGK
ncbi:MAG: tRNA uridine-5-carboxymethylaminomethyl(34) synthesis GTPase MnmE [candidate division Zixibacteria bacterium]|nr:tRNA uridine-5-carboxymethylaminomethyl(34) synthesis GTPase MnmE [candidate division Zixibacteria bacterium]MDD5425205.1 tRNA uridine-5-carboxymethylaminomethyl(34) synthesis GTPase MnmE [candidate division Zixibacteria bacterium]